MTLEQRSKLGAWCRRKDRSVDNLPGFILDMPRESWPKSVTTRLETPAPSAPLPQEGASSVSNVETITETPPPLETASAPLETASDEMPAVDLVPFQADADDEPQPDTHAQIIADIERDRGGAGQAGNAVPPAIPGRPGEQVRVDPVSVDAVVTGLDAALGAISGTAMNTGERAIWTSAIHATMARFGMDRIDWWALLLYAALVSTARRITKVLAWWTNRKGAKDTTKPLQEAKEAKPAASTTESSTHQDLPASSPRQATESQPLRAESSEQQDAQAAAW